MTSVRHYGAQTKHQFQSTVRIGKQVRASEADTASLASRQPTGYLQASVGVHSFSLRARATIHCRQWPTHRFFGPAFWFKESSKNRPDCTPLGLAHENWHSVSVRKILQPSPEFIYCTMDFRDRGKRVRRTMRDQKGEEDTGVSTKIDSFATRPLHDGFTSGFFPPEISASSNRRPKQK